MLCLAYHLNELSFSGLMAIYRESNQENGSEFYPQLPEQARLLRAEQDFYDYLKEDFFRRAGSLYAWWEHQGEMVSALRLEPFRDGFLLEALETAPDRRRQGHAGALMADFLGFCVNTGRLPVYSHIRKGNVPSEKVHRACGFQICWDMAVYVDGSVSSRCRTWRYDG